MNQRTVKKLRREMKAINGFDIKAAPDYRVSKETKKVVYFTTTDKHGAIVTRAVPTTRQCIVNITKLPYRRLKKEFKLRSKGQK